MTSGSDSLSDFDDYPSGPTGPQLEFIESLTEEADLGQEEVLEIAREIAGWDVQDVKALDVGQASELIGELKERKRLRSRGRDWR